MKNEPTLSYMPALDSLRAWAVLMVIFEHYFQYLLPSYFHFFSFGGLGVGLFFTLSGFLITTILLQEKENNKSFILKIKSFYFRRLLRLFPIYYLTYTTNFMVFNTSNWGKVGHFWSLAVEEQFYVFWPFFVLFLNKKWVKIAISLFIISAILFKIVCYFAYSDSRFYWILTPFYFDLLGIGALLAWLRFYKITFWLKLIDLPFKFSILFGLVSLLVILSYLFDIHSLINWILCYNLVGAIAMAWIVTVFSEAKWPIFLHNKALQWIGRISYGMYIYHLPIMGLWGFNSAWFLSKGFDYQFVYWFDNPFIVAFCCLVATFVISLLSYWLIERPINQLKHRL